MLFSIFLVCILHSNLVQLVLPQYLDRRALFEAREGLSKTYSWKVLILSNFLAELPCQTVIAIIQFVTWYFPVGSYNLADFKSTKNERAGLMFLIIWSFTLLSTTFSQMVGTFAPDPATGINISATLWSFCLIFCGSAIFQTSCILS
jgi:ATP-binding cassette subfamily G (WHITE) protein 2 (PDR)